MKNKLLSEQILIDINENLNQVLNIILEIEQESERVFVWDLAKEKLDKSTKSITTPEKAKEYLKIVLNKIKNINSTFKFKIIKYTLSILVGLLSISEMANIISTESPEISKEIKLSKNSLIPNVKKVNDNKNKNKIKTPNKSSETLRNFLKKEEGKIGKEGEPALEAYDINDGSITVGWGHAEKKNVSQFKIGQEITLSLAKKLFEKDVYKAEDAVNDILKKWDKDNIKYVIDQDMYDAMVSMAFNMGRGGLRTSEFIQLVKKGKYKEAKEKILTTNITQKGHISRRKEESDMFGKNLDKVLIALEKKYEQKNKTLSESYKKRIQKLSGII